MQMKEKVELVKCNLCGSEDFTFLFEGHDYLAFSSLTFKVMRCNRCGLVCLNPRPKEMLYYYREYRKKTIEKDVFCWLSPDRVKKIKKFKKGGSPLSGKILDIGCGQGHFLADMNKEEGWEVYGNDISQESCDFARKELGLKNIYNGDILSLDFPENFFDVITLWHVLEHLEKPLETLKKVSRILKNDGMLVIECPDFSSLQRRLFKDKWFAVDLPRHLYQFSVNTLRKVLKSAKLEIYKEDYIVNIRIGFIDLKRSLLRWFRIEQVQKIGELNELAISPHFREAQTLWILARFMFNLMCFLLSSFLNLINCKDIFRLYCRKENREWSQK